MATRSLNVRQAQVLVNYPEDDHGLCWHHRVLLARVRESEWITLTPDLDYETLDMGEIDHEVLDRNARFPDWSRGQLYAFDQDALGAGELLQHERVAKRRADILGAQNNLVESAVVWMVSEPGHAKFGRELPDEIQEDGDAFVNLQSRGLALWDGEVLNLSRVDAGDLEQSRRDMRDKCVDVRVLGTFVDSNGKRDLGFSKGVGLLREPSLPDWPFQGPRLCLELLQCVRDGPGNFVSYHAEWARLSGIADPSAQLHEHKHLCETLRLALQIDQVDVSALATCEQTARRLVQLEQAVQRSPSRPDFTGLDVVTDGAVTDKGAVRAPKFATWLATTQKERAAVLTQRRAYAVELRKARGDPPSDEGRQNRKKKKEKNRGNPMGKGKGGDAPAES